MEDWPSPNQTPTLSSEAPKQSKSSKWLLILLGVVVCALVAEGVYWFWLRGEKEFAGETSVTPSPLVSQTPQLTNIEIAEKVLAWLGKQKDERGVYYFMVECDEGGECKRIPDNRAGIRVLWGNFKYYQKTGSKQALATIEKDLAIYSNKEIIPFIQNDFWNCKLMFEMWQSNLFSEEQKRRIEDICWRGGYYHPLDLLERIKIENFQETVVDEVEDINFDLVEKGDYAFETTISEEDKAKGKEYSVYPSEFVARYLWRNDIAQLTKAKFYFDKAVQLYFSSPSSFDDNCLLGISALDLYQVNKDRGYLDFAQILFEKSREKDFDLTESVHCLFLADELFRLTKEENYKAWKIEKLNYLFQNSFEEDLEEEQGSFRFFKHIRKIFPINENSLLVGFLGSN